MPASINPTPEARWIVSSITNITKTFTITPSTGKTISSGADRIRVEGLLQGWGYNVVSGNTAQFTITRTLAPKEPTEGAWTVIVKYTDTTTESIDMPFAVTYANPVFGTVPAKVKLFTTADANVMIPVTNYRSNGKVKGLLIKLDSENDPRGILVRGRPDRAIAETPGETIVAEVPTSGNPITKNQPYWVSTGTPPAMSTYTASAGNRQVTLTWTAVTDAVSYAYRYKKSTDTTYGEWIDTEGGTSETVTGLENGPTYNIQMRVNQPWIGTAGTAINATPALKVALVDSSRDDIGIFDISSVASGSNLSYEKYFNLPSGWSNPVGITKIAPNKVAVLDNTRWAPPGQANRPGRIGIFDISGSSGSTLTAEKYFGIGLSSFLIIQLSGITYIGNNKVIITSSISSTVYTFDISGNSVNYLIPSENYSISYSQSGITFLGDNRLACVHGGYIRIYSMKNKNSGDMLDLEKTLRMTNVWNNKYWTGIGITFLGDNKCLLVNASSNNYSIYIVDISGDGSQHLIPQFYYNLPSGWTSGQGITVFT